MVLKSLQLSGGFDHVIESMLSCSEMLLSARKHAKQRGYSHATILLLDGSDSSL